MTLDTKTVRKYEEDERANLSPGARRHLLAPCDRVDELEEQVRIQKWNIRAMEAELTGEANP